ncbi:MAG TPA: hypothetical protein VLV83_16795 [Acidobacteriota bacterium]|nr:hypothetical protein [Acidobacteriota bacterium]
MSYLSGTRLHFAGEFSATPSTINNSICNYDPQVTRPQPGWNPNGPAYWQFQNCRVSSLVTAGGTSSGDPLLGAALSTPGQPPAKLVDLDPMQQGASQIFGMEVQVGSSDSASFSATFHPVAFGDLWGRAQGGAQGDMAFSAYYQSVLEEVLWANVDGSDFLKALQSATACGRLSIKFVVDGYNTGTKRGRVVGTIGPYLEGEPVKFVAGRYLRPHVRQVTFGPAWVDEENSKLVVDLGNSLPTESAGGGPMNLGNLQVVILHADARPEVLGDFDYSLAAYGRTAYVQEFELSEGQLRSLARTPLGVIESNTATLVMAENPMGAYLNAEQAVYRISPGQKEKVRVWALQFGKPAAHQEIGLSFARGALGGPVSCRGGRITLPVAQPESALSLPSSVTTRSEGQAEFELLAADPGNPRHFVDGQVYPVQYLWGTGEDPSYRRDPSNILSVLVHNAYEVPEHPTWDADVQPIFSQYAKLYPVMKPIVDLSSYQSVKDNASSVERVFGLSVDNPGYMPVTRDLSPAKQQMVLRWFSQGAPEN